MRARRPGPRYAREIAVVLVVKFVALFVIWNIWFSGPARKGVDSGQVAEKVYSSQPTVLRDGATHATRP